jgi:hypothetical protein
LIEHDAQRIRPSHGEVEALALADERQGSYTTRGGMKLQRIRAAQYEALRAVNRELIALYWDIGRLIVEQQQSASFWRNAMTRCNGSSTCA